MADYNSRFTGTEIDAAVEAAREINEITKVHSGSTDGKVLLTDISINPNTGDRTGLYYIQHQVSGDAATTYSTSMLHIDNESATIGGTGHSSIEASGTVWSNRVGYGNGEIYAVYDNSVGSIGNAMPILGIWRLQKAS